MVDIHAHILPGLDDGPRVETESLRMCASYAEQGVRTVIATPHMLSGRWNVTSEMVREATVRLAVACRRSGIQLEILPGADVALAPELPAKVASGEVLTLVDSGRYLLLELPSQTVPPVLGLVDELAAQGVVPIITHPERNAGFLRRPGMLAELAACGCLVQVTSGSLLGRFGTTVRRAAERFLVEGIVHLIASDAHAPRGGRSPDLGRCRRRLCALVGVQKARRLLCENPGAVARGEALAPRLAPFTLGVLSK
jgi:protein-tyrosine phosphatase